MNLGDTNIKSIAGGFAFPPTPVAGVIRLRKWREFEGLVPSRAVGWRPP